MGIIVVIIIIIIIIATTTTTRDLQIKQRKRVRRRKLRPGEPVANCII